MTLIRTLWSKGIKVPDDLSIIGNDNIKFASQTIPSLTTISYGNIKDTAAIVVSQVLSRLRTPSQPRQMKVIKASLEKRESCVERQLASE